MYINSKTFNPALLANRAKLIKSYLSGRSFVSGFPIELAVEITNRCNADCLMCSRRNMSRPIGDMDPQLFRKIIDEAKSYTELIWLHLAGEPLMHPKLFEIISYAKSRGVKLGLSTNAISLDKARAEGIINSGLDLLIISFDGATKETYEKIRRLSNYEQTVNNIMHYLDRKTAARDAPHTQLQFVYMDENKDEIEKFLKIWRNTSVDSIRFKPYFKFPDAKDDQGVSSSLKPKEKRMKPCIFLWRQCSIYWDGTVVSCCWDFLGQTPLGNIKDRPLKEIWNSRQMRELRELHIKGRYKDIALCRGCNVPQITMPFLLGSAMVDDLTVKKLLPVFDNLSIVNKMKKARYYT